MTPEERELRRALDARSGEVTPQFRARLSSALSAEGRPSSNFLPALAAVAAVVLVFATVGVLLLARQARNEPPPVAATTPSSAGADAEPHASPTPVEPGVLTKPPTPIALPASPAERAIDRRGLGTHGRTEYLYRSTDRGATGSSARCRPPSGVLRQLEISFVERPEGWLTMSGRESGSLQPVRIHTGSWHTTDAGATWQLLGSERHCRSRSARMASRSSIPVAVSSTPGIRATPRSSTGRRMVGSTWIASQPLPDPPGFKTVCIACVAMQTGSVRAFGSTLLVPAWQTSGPSHSVRLPFD